MLQRRSLTSLPTILWPDVRRRVIPEDLYRFLRFLLFLAILCAAIYFYVQPASQILAAQLRIAELKAEHARLQRENAELVRELATYTDIRRVEARARELGYRPPTERLFVRVRIEKPQPLATASERSESPPAVPWWQAALDWATAQLNPPAYAQTRR